MLNDPVSERQVTAVVQSIGSAINEQNRRISSLESKVETITTCFWIIAVSNILALIITLVTL